VKEEDEQKIEEEPEENPLPVDCEGNVCINAEAYLHAEFLRDMITGYREKLF
jgi:hypothetical protein